VGGAIVGGGGDYNGGLEFETGRAERREGEEQRGTTQEDKKIQREKCGKEEEEGARYPASVSESAMGFLSED
jgi:hypothetical protein